MIIRIKNSTRTSISVLIILISCLSSIQVKGQVSVKFWADDRKSAFTFSFDDGCMSQYTYAVPLLDSFKFKGTFAIITDSMTENLPGIARYGTWSQFRSMALEGHEIGSHSVTHPDLTTLPTGDTSTKGTLLYELYQSQKVINQKITNQKCIVMVYPNLAYNLNVEVQTAKFYASGRTGGTYPVDGSLAGLDYYRIVSNEALFDLPRNSTSDDLDELAQMETYADSCVKVGKWGLLELHEVVPFSQIPQLVANKEWYPTSTEWLTSFCQHIKQGSDSNLVWVETMGNITRYMRERQDFMWDILSQTATQITVHGYDTLDNAIYNYPLTVDFTVPADWGEVIIIQGTKTDTVNTFVSGGITCARGHVIPDGGTIILNKVIPPTSTLNLTLLIQGLYNGTSMVPDTVTVELHNSTSPYPLIESQKGVVNSSGAGTFSFANAFNGKSYYLCIRHKNSIQTWSSAPQSFTSCAMSYDFTTAQGKAYGNNQVLTDGKYCIYSGDVNQDGLVDLTDLIAIDNDNANYVTGTAVTDLNGDGLVDLSDLIIADNNNKNYVAKSAPPVN